MVMEKEDLGLGLSLSLSFPQKRDATTNSSTSLPFNLMAPSTNAPFSIFNKMYWPQTTHSSDRTFDTTTSFLKGIDVNRLPEPAEEGGAASSPNSTISSITGKRSERETTASASGSDELEIERGISDDDDGDTSRKKLRLSKDQSAILEESFKEHNTLNPKQKQALAKRLGLRPRQVEVWFQNRRARTKLKQTEVDCELLKRCCDSLTDENRRLQKEVQELRALKLSPQLYMQMSPPTTLTMCPSCERVSTPISSARQLGAPMTNSRQIHLCPAQARPINFNPWAAAQVQHGPFGGLHSRT